MIEIFKNRDLPVEVVVNNYFWDKYAEPQPKYRTYIGKIREPFKWAGTDSFCMSGDQYIDTRVIKFENIHWVKIAGLVFTKKDFSSFIKSYEKTKDKIFIVKGSKGDDYTVKFSKDRGWSCNCAGFGFRSKCKHVELKKNEGI